MTFSSRHLRGDTQDHMDGSRTAQVKVRLTSLKHGHHPMLRAFFEDWDFRQEKMTGVPRHFLGMGHPIPVYGPLPKAGAKKEG
jgi:hypothetical protein